MHIPKGAPDGHKINFSEKVHLPQLPERMGKVTWFIAVVDPLPCISPCQTLRIIRCLFHAFFSSCHFVLLSRLTKSPTAKLAMSFSCCKSSRTQSSSARFESHVPTVCT